MKNLILAAMIMTLMLVVPASAINTIVTATPQSMTIQSGSQFVTCDCLRSYTYGYWKLNGADMGSATRYILKGQPMSFVITAPATLSFVTNAGSQTMDCYPIANLTSGICAGGALASSGYSTTPFSFSWSISP